MDQISVIYRLAQIDTKYLNDRYPTYHLGVLTTPLLQKLIDPLRRKLESIGFEIASEECVVKGITIVFESFISKRISAGIYISRNAINSRILDGIYTFHIDEYINGPVEKWGRTWEGEPVILTDLEQHRKNYMLRCRARQAALKENIDAIFVLLPQPIAEEIEPELSIKYINDLQ